jgi:hypothetical protein
MPAWVPAGGGGDPTFSGGGAGSTRKFYSTGQGAPSGVASVYHPTASGGGGGDAGGDTKPGVFSINPLDPLGSVEAAKDPITGLIAGLKDGLLGTSQPDAQGKHGGLIGDVPLVGDLTRAGAETIANAGGAAAGLVGHGLDAIGGTLERIPGSDQQARETDLQYEDPGLQAWLDEKNAEGKTNREAIGTGDKGLLGTGALSNEEHYKAVAIRQYQEAQQVKNPSLFGGKFTPAPSLADSVNTLFDLMGAGENLVQRGVAGWDKANGMNQLDTIKKVGDGQAAWDVGSPENTPVEQLAYEKTKSGEWTDDEALDWIATHGAGYSHDVRLQVLGTVALDPLNAAAFGAGAVAKLGLKGASVVAGSERAAKLLDEARVALKAAEEAQSVTKGVRAGKRAAAEVARLTEDVGKAEKAVEGWKAYQATSGVSRLNPAAKVVEGSERVQDLLKIAGKAYNGLEGTYIGRAAKVTRTLIDPLHAIDLHMPGNARTVDLLSDSLTKTLSTTIGDTHYLDTLNDFAALDKTGQALDSYARDVAVAMTNRGREGILQMHQAGAVMKGAGGKLAGAEGAALRDEVIEAAAASMKEKDLLKWLRYDVTKNILKHDWSEAAHAALAQQLEAIYHVRSAAEWMKVLPGMSKEHKSLLKLAAYGNSNSRLLRGISNSAGHASAQAFDLNRMVLLAKTTLTRVGGESLLSKLTKPAMAGSPRKAMKLILDWQEQYPELRYIAMDPANPGKSVERMIRYLEDHLDSMPMQVKNDELKKLHPDLQELSATLGEGYTLGFRPKDEFLWGIERANEAGGEYIAKRVPWADHVGEGGLGYRPGRRLPLNIAGMPIIGAPISKALKAVDYMEAGSRMVMAQVSGAQIHEVARQRFVSEAVRGPLAEHGLTERVAQQWWDRLQEYTREHQGYSGPRGFGKGDLYNAIAKERLIPQTLLNGSMRMQESDILRMVMQAYDGDMRYIGLTQKLSGRAKRVLSAATGYNSNFAGQIAEHAWPTLKFRYNPIFQLQEKVEPWVLNTQRGITAARGTTLNEADIATERLLQRMTDNSLLRQADLDQAEYSAQVLLGKRLGELGRTPGTRIQKVASMANALMDVQGVKRLNMLRTFRQGLGKDLRAAWDEAQPGVWDDMFLDAQARAGKAISEDEFALQMMGENLFANDIVVSRLLKSGRQTMTAEWDNAIKPGAWHTPSHIGELKGLDLDHVAASMQTLGTDGKRIENLADLRKYVAEDNTRINEVGEFLNRMGASPDYVARVENALSFSWEGFWNEAAKRFSLTGEESRALQDMVAGSASVRGMSPADYMSQVFNPGILDGTEGLIGSLDKPLGILRRNKAGDIVGRGRSRLAGKAGESTREDLVRQLSGVFSAHLDPSAKRALLMEFKPELRKAVMRGDVRLDLRDLKVMWDADAEGELADRIIGYMDGKPGTFVHDVVTDETRGIKGLRDAADRYLQRNGVTPLGERRHYRVDDAHYEQTAKEYSAMPEVEYEKTARRPTSRQVYNASTDLKPKPAGVDDRTYETYQQFVTETRAQFDFITAPKGKGGMGIKVTVAKGDPYTADDAGRAAMRRDIERGELRVMGIKSDHPLMTNEQNVMFRAVHDIFGHQAEGFGFGPRGELNAAANHFKLYSADARGALLSETHGQTAWVNYSDDIYKPTGPAVGGTPLDAANPADDFERRFPFEMPERQAKFAKEAKDVPMTEGWVRLGDSTAQLDYLYTKRVGAGIRNMPEDQQAAILQPLADQFEAFPNMRVHHVDVVSFSTPLDSPDADILLGLGNKTGAGAMTFGADTNETVILYNADHFDAFRSGRFAANNQYTKQYDTFHSLDPATGKMRDMPRKSAFGAPYTVSDDVASIVRHENGHAFDVTRRPHRVVGSKKDGTPVWENKALPGQEAYGEMIADFEKRVGRLDLSEYGMTNSAEFVAELFSYSTDPKLIVANIESKELRAIVEEFQTFLKDTGEWVQPQAADAALAGKRIRDINAAKRGTVYAPNKAGILPQSTIDQFAQQFVGVGKHVESNPDVARTAQMFGKWSEGAVTNGLLRGDKAVHAGLLNDIAGIPTSSAAPYNLTEGLAAQLAIQTMQSKWEDAFRLQYFSQERTMLERTVNHPMFGLYPASYMWGKIMPEVVQFIAQRPFGIRTGGAAYSAMDAQAAIALQREYNPEFDAMIEKLGHSQALSWAGYLLPTLPWDISASAPQWMKDVAAQGTRNQKAATAGQPVEDFNAVQPATDVVSKLNPLETTIPWLGRAIDEMNGPNTPAEKRRALIEQRGATKATGLSPELQLVMDELRAALTK